MSRNQNRCSVSSCQNRFGSTDANVSFLKVPDFLQSQWERTLDIDYDINVTPLICSLHFDTGNTFVRMINGANATSTKDTTEDIEFEYSNDVINFVDVNDIEIESTTVTPMQQKPESIGLNSTNLDYKRKYEIVQKEYEKSQLEITKLRAMLRVFTMKSISTKKTVPKKVLKQQRCEICSKWMSAHSQHLCSRQENEIKCQYCTASFKSTFDMMSHLRATRHTNIRFYKCGKCTMIFPTAVLIKFHQEVHVTSNQVDGPIDAPVESNNKLAESNNVAAETMNVAAETTNVTAETTIVAAEINNVAAEPSKKVYFGCGLCESTFDLPGELKEHVRGHYQSASTPAPFAKNSASNKFECFICKVEFDSLNRMKAHFESHYEACVICHQKLTSNDIDRHICDSENNIKCEYCSISFDAVKKLLRHLEDTHTEDIIMYKCRECAKYFGMERIRDLHKKRHIIVNSSKQFICEICPKRYATKYQLEIHLETHSTEKNHLCPECGRAFRTEYHLKTHSKTHENIIYHCTECPANFRKRASFVRHQDVHRNVKYRCTECPAVLSTKTALDGHFGLKHRNRPKKHVCTYCSLRFAKKDKLKVHLRKHTGERPCVCQYCDRKYTYKGDLIKHLQIHVGNQIYKCEECDQGFRLQIELKNHTNEHFRQKKEQLQRQSLNSNNVQ